MLATLGEVSTCSLIVLPSGRVHSFARATPPSLPSVLEISQRDTP